MPMVHIFLFHTLKHPVLDGTLRVWMTSHQLLSDLWIGH
jgi:hypothetical protein